MNQQAEVLNKRLEQGSSKVLEMLSVKGKRLYFPYEGILGQAAEAKQSIYNATVGIAKEDDQSPMVLDFMSKWMGVDCVEAFPYAPSHGLLGLRKIWRQMMLEKNPLLEGQGISTPIVTQALTHALTTVGTLFLNPGDEVLIPAPYWDNYGLLFEEHLEASLRPFSLFVNGAFNIRALEHELERKQGQRINIVFNVPNNPTGYSPTVAEMQQIVFLLRQSAEAGSKLVLLIDDAYFGLVYEEGVERQSLFAYTANLHENILAIKIDGCTKEDYAWGLRVGFVTYGNKSLNEDQYKALEDKTAGCIRASISNCSKLSQSLMLKAFNDDNYARVKLEKYDILKSRFFEFKQQLDAHSEYKEYFHPLPFNSGYFMCLSLKDGVDPESVRRLLLESYKTGVLVLEGYIRIAFSSLPKDSIGIVLRNIYEACKSLSEKPTA